MRAPHYFFWGNLVLRTPTDAWAVYELEGQSYPGTLRSPARSRWVSDWRRSAYILEADFQILRVARAFDAAAYERRALGTLDPRHGQRERFERHLAETSLRVRAARRAAPGDLPRRPPRRRPAAAGRWRAARRAGGALARSGRAVRHRGRGRGSGQRAARCAAARRGGGLRAGARLSGVPAGRPAAAGGADPPRLHPRPRRARRRRELRARRRSASWTPAGRSAFEPYGYDLLRLHESRVTIERRSLADRLRARPGPSGPAGAGRDARGGAVPGPSGRADVHAAGARLRGRRDALGLLPRQPRGAATGGQAQSRRRPDRPRGISGRSRPFGRGGRATRAGPRAGGGARRWRSAAAPAHALVLSVAGRDEEELEERVERLRESYGRVQLHRPGGEQHRLFLASLPAASSRCPSTREHLLPDQLGAMVPHAISQAGSRIGPYIGHTLTGSRSPVQFDLAEACQ